MQDFFSQSTYTLIVCSFFCAIVRWVHICRPYSRYSDYFYPNRVETTSFYLILAIAYLPYWIYDNADWHKLYGSFIGLITIPAFVSALILRYFIKRAHKVKRHLLFFSAIIPSLPFIVDALLGGNVILVHHHEVRIASLILGLLETLQFGYCINALLNKIKRHNISNYSCEEDFPYIFSWVVISMSVLSVTVLWTVWISQSILYIAIKEIIFTILSIALLLIILHPQQPSSKQFYFKWKQESPVQEDQLEEEANDEDLKSLALQIKKILYERKLYLDPHFSLVQLADAIGYGRTITSKTCNAFFGGFYQLVNQARLEHANNVQANNPNYTIDAIAKESGFSSRHTYLRVKKRFLENNE